MIDTIYLESGVRDHPRSRAIIERYPRARIIECASYQSIFNRRRQNFRTQKLRPALILAEKTPASVHPVPSGQDLGAAHNYYFSHLLNCPFDCRYCFLQGMFSSANYVLFVNYEDFAEKIHDTCAGHREKVHIFSGYDCDSLALEPMTHFAEFFVPLFANINNALLELRTKSLQIRSLLSTPAHDNCIIAMSLAPDVVVENLEHGTPELGARLASLERLQAHGWSIGLRFDPLIAVANGAQVYDDFFSQVFARLDPQGVHSATFGALRLPRSFAKKMISLYPEERLFCGAFDDIDGTLVACDPDSLQTRVQRRLEQELGPNKIFRQQG